jgi:hypothetical protein
MCSEGYNQIVIARPRTRLVSGTHFYYLKGSKIGTLFSLVWIVSFPVSVESLISFISPYIYELPIHHCPFCVLQKEYHYLGCFVYMRLLLRTIAGPCVGVLMPFRFVLTLREGLPFFPT